MMAKVRRRVASSMSVGIGRWPAGDDALGVVAMAGGLARVVAAAASRKPAVATGGIVDRWPTAYQAPR